MEKRRIDGWMNRLKKKAKSTDLPDKGTQASEKKKNSLSKSRFTKREKLEFLKSWGKGGVPVIVAD